MVSVVGSVASPVVSVVSLSEAVSVLDNSLVSVSEIFAISAVSVVSESTVIEVSEVSISSVSVVVPVSDNSLVSVSEVIVGSFISVISVTVKVSCSSKDSISSRARYSNSFNSVSFRYARTHSRSVTLSVSVIASMLKFSDLIISVIISRLYDSGLDKISVIFSAIYFERFSFTSVKSSSKLLFPALIFPKTVFADCDNFSISSLFDIVLATSTAKFDVCGSFNSTLNSRLVPSATKE